MILFTVNLLDLIAIGFVALIGVLALIAYWLGR